jgi:hypothetical protein
MAPAGVSPPIPPAGVAAWVRVLAVRGVREHSSHQGVMCALLCAISLALAPQPHAISR